MRTKNDHRARRLLKAQLDVIAARLQKEAEVPKASVAGDFLDVAQGVERQELARLSGSRLTQRARSLRIALTRVSEYGVCSECGASIPPQRLLAVPDTNTAWPARSASSASASPAELTARLFALTIWQSALRGG